MWKSVGVLAAIVSLLMGCAPAESDERPESDQIAFVSDRDGNSDIFLFDLGRDSVVNLTAHPAMDYGFSWSPDGEALAFASDRDGNQEIYLLDIASGVVSRLTEHEARDGSPSWSPDGQQIAFVSRRHSDSGEIYVMNVDGGEVRRITDNDRYEEVPSWSPDGASLAFGALASAADAVDPTLQIFRVQLATRVESQLTFLAGHNSAPRWAPDGSAIFFYGQVGEAFEGADIMVMAPDGTALRNLTNDGEPDWQPDPSPDGSRIVFARGPGEPLDLWVMRTDGTERRALFTNPGRDEQPKWRPRP
ncbi:MAG: PD40 domain-containing protein [Gemmatimonadetes bacterium]|nr:PD40 domain-containing protein [Gemmatimonadota bacterium]MBT8402800.1 PD40 domain-containing protein [Gemmatimonadota bacterium]NNK61717.1 translocation protein TolB [Gemmatimonadota bacterium]